MGPFGSKHILHKKHSNECSAKKKESFLSRILRKSIGNKKRSTSTKKIKQKSSKNSRTVIKSTEKSKNDNIGKNHNNETESMGLSEEHSQITVSSVSTPNHQIPGIRTRKHQKNQRGKVADRSFRGRIRRIPDWSSSSSLRSIRSARKKIKALFSRPMQDKSVQKVIEKIKQRNELRQKTIFTEEIPETPLRKADEKFPFRYESTKRERDKTTPLFKDSTENDEEEEITDDHLPMNSDVLLEVHAGLRKLVKMPKIRIVMDPYAPLDYLKSRDEIFFTDEIIFSNTVRSMVNLNDELSSRNIISKRSRKLNKILVEEPTQITQYDQNNPMKHKQIPL